LIISAASGAGSVRPMFVWAIAIASFGVGVIVVAEILPVVKWGATFVAIDVSVVYTIAGNAYLVTLSCVSVITTRVTPSAYSRCTSIWVEHFKPIFCYGKIAVYHIQFNLTLRKSGVED
jgi:hypothetical protein